MLSIRDRYWKSELERLQCIEISSLSSKELRSLLPVAQTLKATAPDEDCQIAVASLLEIVVSRIDWLLHSTDNQFKPEIDLLETEQTDLDIPQMESCHLKTSQITVTGISR